MVVKKTYNDPIYLKRGALFHNCKAFSPLYFQLGYFFLLIVGLHLLSRLYLESIPMPPMINGCYCPCNTNTKEYVDSITTGYVTNTGVCIFVLYGRHFTSKGICILCVRVCLCCDCKETELLHGWDESRGFCAELLCYAQIAILSQLPGILVPSATKTIAVTESLMPNVQPKCDATSPITAVTTPMQKIDTTKQT